MLRSTFSFGVWFPSKDRIAFYIQYFYQDRTADTFSRVCSNVPFFHANASHTFRTNLFSFGVVKFSELRFAVPTRTCTM